MMSSSLLLLLLTIVDGQTDGWGENFNNKQKRRAKYLFFWQKKCLFLFSSNEQVKCRRKWTLNVSSSVGKCGCLMCRSIRHRWHISHLFFTRKFSSRLSSLSSFVVSNRTDWYFFLLVDETHQFISFLWWSVDLIATESNSANLIGCQFFWDSFSFYYHNVFRHFLLRWSPRTNSSWWFNEAGERWFNQI